MTTALLWVALAAVLAPGLLAVPAMQVSRGGGRVHATGQEIEIGYRPGPPVLLAVLAFGATGVLGTVALASGPIPAAICGMLAVLAGLVLISAVGTLRRRPRVLLTARGLVYRGWGLDASVAWEDVESTAIDRRYPWRPLAEVLVAPGATSLRRRVARLAVPEPAGPRTSIRMWTLGLEDPQRLLAFVQQLAACSVSERRGRLGARGLAFLTGAEVRGDGTWTR